MADQKNATVPENTCANAGCGKPSSMQCPKCVEYKLPKTLFCSQECFKAAWSEHNKVHLAAKERTKYRPPSFPYTGPLRPAYIPPGRKIPANVPKPDYAETGEPISEYKQRDGAKIHIHTPDEIKSVREACRIGREALDAAGHAIRPGVTTDEIDEVVHNAIISRGAYPSPLNYKGFPKSCCTSVNEVICHGIPDMRPLEEGDIVNVDVSVYYQGFHGDLSETFLVGKVDEDSKNLVKTTYEALMLAVKAVKPGVFFRDFGEIITKHVSPHKYQVVRSYCGHGIGRLFHTVPNIPHYQRNKAVGVAKPGMIFTIEPMINAGSWRDETWEFDGWTSVTADGKRSAQFEHQVLVTEDGCEILTARTAKSLPFFWETPAPNATVESKDGSALAGEKKKKKKKPKKKKAATATAGAGEATETAEAEDAEDGDEGGDE